MAKRPVAAVTGHVPCPSDGHGTKTADASMREGSAGGYCLQSALLEELTLQPQPELPPQSSDMLE